MGSSVRYNFQMRKDFWRLGLHLMPHLQSIHVLICTYNSAELKNKTNYAKAEVFENTPRNHHTKEALRTGYGVRYQNNTRLPIDIFRRRLH